MKELVIVGAGGFGRELLQWVKEINAKTPTWLIKGFIDDNIDALTGYECDYSVVGTIQDCVPQETEEYVIAIANPQIKEKVVKALTERGAHFASVIHPDAHVGSFNKIGKGVVFYPGSRITVNTAIGDFVTLLDLATIGHDVSIGNYTTVCGSCGINGHVSLGDRVFVGSHATFVPGTKAGNDAFIGAGSLVMSPIRANTRVFGVPAKKIKF